MKTLEDKIIGRIYREEARLTGITTLIKIASVAVSAFLVWVFFSVILDILHFQGSWDLLDFRSEDFEVVRKFFFTNLISFIQELPAGVLLAAAVVLSFFILFIIISLRNISTVKNKLRSIYKFYRNKK